MQQYLPHASTNSHFNPLVNYSTLTSLHPTLQLSEEEEEEDNMEGYINTSPLDSPVSSENEEEPTTTPLNNVVIPTLTNIENELATLKERESNEILYVNAKQYHRIMKRRAARSRLESLQRLSFQRKPYLHESRHLHATKRARNPDGTYMAKVEPTTTAETTKQSKEDTEGEEIEDYSESLLNHEDLNDFIDTSITPSKLLKSITGSKGKKVK